MIFLNLYYQNHWKSKNLFIRKPLYKKKSTAKKIVSYREVLLYFYWLTCDVMQLKKYDNIKNKPNQTKPNPT